MSIFKTILLTIIFSTSILLAENEELVLIGQDLHDAKCTKCHTTTVYSRLDHKVNSLELLTKRVNGCVKNAVREDWTDKQKQSVVHYLNESFYEF